MDEFETSPLSPSAPGSLFPPLPRIKRSGEEVIHSDGKPVGPRLIDFWKWSVSDLVSNATRGRLAEFIVASAIGADLRGVRNEWSPYDVKAPWGLTIEVKSAAFIQTWAQRGYSTISFSTRKSRAWDPSTNILSKELTRQAECYVFALLAHKERETIDPLNVCQWKFHVASTTIINARTRSQDSISYNSLIKLCGDPLDYIHLRAELEKVPH
jgi:hypothetical protein